jgi:hypothetical protein
LMLALVPTATATSAQPQLEQARQGPLEASAGHAPARWRIQAGHPPRSRRRSRR